MEFQYILFEVDQGIATITLNRPKQMNSLNLEIIQEMGQAIDACAADPEVRVVVLTGAGEVFSAGDDIKIMGMARDHDAKEIAEVIETQGYPVFIRKAMSLPKPVIACVNGMCFGAGGEIALACDHVIASDKASFGQLYVNVGLMGNTYLLPRVVGAKRALELIWGGKIISAEEAYQMGMINAVVPADNLVEATQKLAKRLAKGPTKAYGAAKMAVYEGLSLNLEEGLHVMCQQQGPLMKSEDHKEGVAAFLEKRKPAFKGR